MVALPVLFLAKMALLLKMPVLSTAGHVRAVYTLLDPLGLQAIPQFHHRLHQPLVFPLLLISPLLKQVPPGLPPFRFLLLDPPSTLLRDPTPFLPISPHILPKFSLALLLSHQCFPCLDPAHQLL